MKSKPPRVGRPPSGRVPITANVTPAVRAALRARAKQMAKADGNIRPQLGEAIESYVLGFPIIATRDLPTP